MATGGDHAVLAREDQAAGTAALQPIFAVDTYGTLRLVPLGLAANAQWLLDN